MLKLFKRLALAFVLALAAPLGVNAANLPLLTGPNYSDASQILGSLDQVIQNINQGVSGLLSTLTAAVTSSGTTIAPLFTYIMPGGQMASAGQMVHVKAWGTNSADANVKTVTFSFGGQTEAVIVTGSSNNWVADLYVTKLGANSQSALATGATGTTGIANQQTNSWTVTDTAAITILVEATAATAGTMTLNGTFVEQMK